MSDDSFSRPYLQQLGNQEPRIVYLTDREFDRLSHQGTIRRLVPGEVERIMGISSHAVQPERPLTPEVPVVPQIAPTGDTRVPRPNLPNNRKEAADTAPGDVEEHPVPEVREREVS